MAVVFAMVSSAVACSSDDDGGASNVASGGIGGASGEPCLPSGRLMRSPDNPALRNGPESYDSGKTGPRVVHREPGGQYRLWYEAVASSAGTLTTVGYATSDDGIVWTKQGPVMEPSESWEGNEVSPQSLLVEDGVYKLWYHGGGATEPQRNIGYATSLDGLTWTRQRAPVLRVGAPGSFDEDEAAEPRVLVVGGEYWMFYTGATSDRVKSLGLATSPDGTTWRKDPRSPILDTRRWGNYWGGAFFLENGVFHLWHGVEGGAGALHYKWSLDGTTWTDGDKNPVLEPGSTPNGPDTALVGDSVSGFRDGDEYRIYYTGFASNLFGSEGRFEGICMASVAAPSCP